MEAASFVPQIKLVPLVQLFDHHPPIRYKPLAIDVVVYLSVNSSINSDARLIYSDLSSILDKFYRSYHQILVPLCIAYVVCSRHWPSARYAYTWLCKISKN